MNKLVYLVLSILDISKTYPYPTNALKACKKENLSKYKWLIFIIILMKTEHKSKCPYIPDHLYRILIIEASGSGKTNALLNLINYKLVIDKIYLYAKYQFLINKRESTVLKHFNDHKAFIEYSNDMQNVYKNI